MASGDSAAEEVAYVQEDLAHESDFSTPLHHGVIRYVPGPSIPLAIRNILPIKNDRPYVYVPVGYLNREENYIDKILSALRLTRPNLIVVTAETRGSAEEQVENSYAIQDAASHSIAKDWTEAHSREVLQHKVGQLLQSSMESCVEVGAWLMPQCPRRRNGAAQMICEALPKSGKGIALGVLGLDERDVAEGLKPSLTTGMVPLGSPVKTVSKISYDINTQDGAPCPQLTHLLIFESPHEMNRFRDELLALVPDMLLAFGDITNDGMQSVFDNAVDGSPVILLKHTGKNIDALCRMFKHVRNHMNCKMNATPTSTAQAPSLIDFGGASGNELQTSADPCASQPDNKAFKSQTTLPDHQIIKIPPMEGEENELIRLFINTWPANFNSKSVVLADPLILSGSSFQKRILSAVTAAFDLKIGGTDTRKAKRQALNYAWSFYDVANSHSKLKKRSAESLHIQLMTCTLVSIIASIVYDQVYGGGGHPKGGIQLFVFVLTILLPLYITSLKQESDNNNPVVRWAAFKVAAAKMESEIFKFRAQVGPYRAAEKTESSMQRPLYHFSTKTRETWLGIKQYLHDDGMFLPDDFWELNPPNGGRQTSSTETDAPTWGLSSLKTKSPLSICGGWFHKNEVWDVPPNESTPMLKVDQHGEITEEEPIDEDYDDEDPPEKVFVDDHYSPMTADEYIEHRMKGQMRKKVERLQQMVDRNQKTSKVIKLITVFSGATAALSLQWCVPIILGVTAALGTSQEFRKYPRRIELGNTMVVRLNELKLWWMGLSMYEKQLPHNKDRLIQTSEQIILAEITSSFDGQNNASQED